MLAVGAGRDAAKAAAIEVAIFEDGVGQKENVKIWLGAVVFERRGWNRVYSCVRTITIWQRPFQIPHPNHQQELYMDISEFQIYYTSGNRPRLNWYLDRQFLTCRAGRIT